MTMAITTRSLAPSAVRGARIKAQARRASEGARFSRTVSYDFEGMERAHCAAAKELAVQLGWSGVYVQGTVDLGEQFKNVRAWVNIGGGMASDRELLAAAMRSAARLEGEDFFTVGE